MSMGEVARCAGVSKGSVTDHFVAKADLIHAVVAEVFDSIMEFLESRLGRVLSDAFAVCARLW